MSTVSTLIRIAVGDWAMMVVIWLIAAQTPPELSPLWIVLLAGRIHALGVVLHDLIHLPRGAKTTAWRVCEVLAGYPLALTADAMRYHHLRHHRENGLAEDPYSKFWIGTSRVRLWVTTLRYFLLVPLWVLRGPFGALAFYFPSWRNSYGRWFLQDRSGADLTNSPKVIRCAREERWQVLFHALLLVPAIAYPHWFLTYFAMPAVLGGYLAGYRLLVEHVQERNYDRSLLTTIRSTNDHHLGLFGRVLVAPHNVGYHRVHHLHPQAGLENLPKLRSWYREHHPEIYPA